MNFCKKEIAVALRSTDCFPQTGNSNQVLIKLQFRRRKAVKFQIGESRGRNLHFFEGPGWRQKANL